MKHLNINQRDLFQEQLKNFKALLIGSKMAKLSAIFLAVFSLVAAFICRANLEQAIPLLLGAIMQIVYAIKYLQVTDIKQKSYTQMSLQNSIVKLKAYLLKREKYEIPVIAFQMITFIPFALRYESVTFVTVVLMFFLGFISVFGILAFRKTNSHISALETSLKKELL